MSRPLLTLLSLFSLLVLGTVAILLGIAYTRRQGPVHATKPAVPGRSTLGVHTLVGQEDGRADAVAQTRPLMTEERGSAFIAVSAGYVSNGAAPVDNKGNQWQPFGERVVYAGYDGRFDVAAYLVLNGQGGADHRVWIEKHGEPKGELTMPVVEVRNAGRLVDAQQNYAPLGNRLTSGTVTTDGPALLVAFWWGDGRGLRHSAVPDNGFEIVERFTRLPPNSAVQCAVAIREVDRAGEYKVTWSTTPAQGAPLWLFAFDPQQEAGDSPRKPLP